MSGYTTCRYCGTRVILARGVPPLNYWPDAAGTVAAQHLASLAWSARFLARGEEPVVPEKRYSLHQCEEARRAGIEATRDVANAAMRRHREGARPRQGGTAGVVLPFQRKGHRP